MLEIVKIKSILFTKLSIYQWIEWRHDSSDISRYLLSWLIFKTLFDLYYIIQRCHISGNFLNSENELVKMGVMTAENGVMTAENGVMTAKTR